jgi:NodT family efflux transporter outer membrane factor (OMF) lipoprotein
MTMTGSGTTCTFLALSITIACGGCATHSQYVAPGMDTPPAFKENWKAAEPGDAIARGRWWEVFGDPSLNALEERIAVSNETLKAAEARFQAARAAVRGARAGLFPQVTASPSIARAALSGNRAVSSYRGPYSDFLAPVDVSYEADVWGRIRSTIDVNRRTAQATAADLEAAALGLHSELAIDYFMLRGLDAEKALLDSTVAAYARALELTQNRFRGGLASQADVAQAETQLETTRAEAVDVGAARATLEHAIATLVGQAASSFSVEVLPLAAAPPSVPAGVPSDLLERRPDIAAAERRVAAANAQVGVTTAALYPILTLSATAGFEASSFGSWLATASNFWSIAPALLVNVFDAGARRATSDQARALYAESAATYRETVLSAFQEVEDELATLRVLQEEAAIQANAVAAAEHSLDLATNRYRGGVVTYLEVITAQSAALTNQRAAVNVLTRRMDTTVLLIKALGGGWDRALLPELTAAGLSLK